MMADQPALIERIHTACLTVQRLPADGPKGHYALWPRYKLAWWDTEEWGSHRTDSAVTAALIKPPQFYPTAAQVDDCLPALALLDGTPQRWRRIVSARAHQDWYGYSGGWRAIGADCGCSPMSALRYYRRAMRHAFQRAQVLQGYRHAMNCC